MNPLRWLSCAVMVAVFFWLMPQRAYADVVDITAESAILMDADSGQVLYEKNADKRLPPASMTKLMTLILAVEAIEEGRVKPDDKVVASENAWRLGGSQIYLEPQEEMTYQDLLVAIAVGSANDACVAIAEHLDGSHEAFVERMNQKAKELGLRNTHFANSYGLPAEGHLTTARDMAVMARYALTFPRILEYTSIKEYDLRGGEFKLYNTNKLLWWYKGVDGFKTGWTNEARYCLVSTAKRGDLRLIAVVMGCEKPRSNFKDTMALYNYGFARYSYHLFVERGGVCGKVQVGKGKADQVEVVAKENIGTLCLKGEEKKITYRKKMADYANAPVLKGQKLGEAWVYRDNQLVKKVDLVAARKVQKASFGQELRRMWKEILTI